MSLGRTGTSPRRPGASGRVGGAGRGSLSFEDDDRNLSLRPRRVLVVMGPDLRHEPPEALTLATLGIPRADRPAVAHDLDPGLRIRAQVEVPARMGGRAALRRDEDDVVAVPAEDEGVRPLLAGRAAGGEKDRDRRVLLPAVADLAVRLEI